MRRNGIPSFIAKLQVMISRFSQNMAKTSLIFSSVLINFCLVFDFLFTLPVLKNTDPAFFKSILHFKKDNLDN